MSKPHVLQVQPQQQSLPSVLPHAAWMWKPRSKKAIKDNLGEVAASFLGVRKLGAQQWKRRYVFVENDVIYYGKDIGEKDKAIPMETIRAANYATRDTLLAAKAPSMYASFGWFMYINGKELLFCCENVIAREEWVTFILAVLQLMSGLAKPVAQIGGDVEVYTTHSLVTKNVHRGRGHNVLQSQITSIVSSPGNGSATFSRGPLGGDTVSEASELRSPSHGEPLHSPSLVIGDGEWMNTAFTTEPVSTHPNPDPDEEDILDDNDMTDLDGDTVVLPQPTTLVDRSLSHSQNALDPFARILLPKADQRHSHIEYKLDSLKEHFRPEDSIQNVVFSRSVEKIGKKDIVQERDLILTSQYFYLISKSRLTGGTLTRCISTDHIVGVIESTTEKNLMAILIPSFHDILIRFHSHNSRVGGDETEVKFQFIAHLYKIHLERHLSSHFIIREVENVRAVIRRNEKEQYSPFVSVSEDRMQVGTNKTLFPIFRANAESVVYWSSMITCIEPGGQPRLRALVVTDGAFYIVNSTLVKVKRRTSLADLVKIMYDRDSQTVLIHVSEVDTLFTVQSSDEFSQLIVLLPKIAQECCNVCVHATASKQLYAQAKLLDAKDEQRSGETSRLTKLKHRVPSYVTQPEWFRAYLDRIQCGDGDPTARDNSDEDSHVNNPGSRGFLAQFRFVEEVYLEFEDESKILGVAEDAQYDALDLKQSFLTDFDVGQIAYSSKCNKVDLKFLSGLLIFSDQVIEDGGVCRVACVSTKGLMLLHHANDIAKLQQPFKNMLLGLKTPYSRSNPGVANGGFSTNDSRVDVFIPWADVIGLIRCHSDQGTVVGVMTGSGHSNDYMLDMGSDEQMKLLISVAAWCYIQHTNSPPCAYTMLPLYKVPRAENVRNALKKTVFDPSPTIALRHPPDMYTSDDLYMAVVPEIAEACRRFGDNTIYFSGLAWRPQNSALKDNDMVEMCEKERRKKRKHKIFIIVLTNCAIYCCTKDGFEIVRRTELLSLREVFIGRGDTNTLLLKVPDEYDLLFHIDGRGKEFLARLQEAHALWTDHDLYLSHESAHSHILPKSALSVTVVPHLAAVGRSEKPPHFDEQQASRPASEAKTRMQLLHCRHLTLAIAPYESVLESAAQPGQTWRRVYESLCTSRAVLAFFHHRAYRFSIRHTSCEEMRHAQLLLYQFDQMTSLVNDMLSAIATEDLVLYERAAHNARTIAVLRLFLDEHRAKYEALLQRRVATDAIASFLDSVSRPPLRDAEAELDALFRRATDNGVAPASLNALRRRADFLSQREGLTAHLSARPFAMGPSPPLPPPAVAELLSEAARQLCVPVAHVDAAIPRAAPTDWRRTAAAAAGDAIGAAVDAGDAPLLRDALLHAEAQLRELRAVAVVLDDDDDGDQKDQKDQKDSARPLQEADAAQLRARIAWGRDQLDAHTSHEGARRAAGRLVARVARGQHVRSGFAEDIAARRSECEAALLRLPAAVPVLAHDRRVLALQLRMLAAGPLQRLARRDAHVRHERLALACHAREWLERQSAQHPRDLCAAEVESAAGAKATGKDKDIGEMPTRPPAPLHGTVAKVSGARGVVDTEKAADVPAEVLAMVRAFRRDELIAYVRAREGQLPADVLAKTRELWVAARAQREWVQQLHRAVHTAFALRNEELLQSQIDAARAAGYFDDVMDSAAEVLAAMKNSAKAVAPKEVEEDLHPCSSSMSSSSSDNASNASVQSGPNGVEDEVIPGLLELSHRYDPHAPNATDALMGALHEATRSLLCRPRDAQCLSVVAQQWLAVLENRLRPAGGVLRRVPRDCFDLLRFASSFNDNGDCAAPYTNRMFGDFERVMKLHAPTGINRGHALIAYLFQCVAMERVVYEITQMEPKTRAEVFHVDALLNQPQYIGDLLLLARMGQHGDWSDAINQFSALAPVNASVETKLNTPDKLGPKGNREVLLRHCREMIRAAVSTLSVYFAKQLAVLGVNPSSGIVSAVLDENAHREVGFIVHKHLLPALMGIMKAGFRSTYQFVRTRQVWEALLQFGEGLQEGSRDISSVAVGGALLLVTAVTDREGRNRIPLSRLSEDELHEVRLRMFLIECLNRNVLAAFLRLFFQCEGGSAQWTGKDGLLKFYDPQLSVCIPSNEKETADLMEIIEMMSKLPFVLVIDRELR